MSRRPLYGDLALYGLSAVFAGVTAATSTLVPHRAWGSIAVFGYCAAVLGALLLPRARLLVAGLAWVAVALVPLVVQAVQRSGGRTDRAQEEVVVTELAGDRLLHTGTPYLDRSAIAALPADERLLGYTPYQPGMAVFGVPRAVLGEAWWTDARVWFALVTIAALAGAGLLLRGRDLVRAAQAATVLPICALTLATGGDDLPVLALCLLAFALVVREKWGYAGLAVGAAGALKLFAWPVALVLLVLARGNPRFAVGAVGLPLLVLLPAILVDRGAAVENLVRFPLGDGLVTSPAQSPLPGYLIATYVPHGRTVAIGLLLAAGLAIAGWLLRHPPTDAAAAATVTAIGLTSAIMLTPATRFGYLLYPIAYAVAVPALRMHSREPVDGRTQVG